MLFDIFTEFSAACPPGFPNLPGFFYNFFDILFDGYMFKFLS
jgi:hypothetical protein